VPTEPFQDGFNDPVALVCPLAWLLHGCVSWLCRNSDFDLSIILNLTDFFLILTDLFFNFD
jgi:hypothetical protein